MDLPISKTLAWRVFQATMCGRGTTILTVAALQFPDLRRVAFEGVRLRTGFVYSWGGAPELTPTAACSVQPTEVLVGEPIAATVTASNFNPKHPLTYSWSGNGGQVVGKDTSATSIPRTRRREVTRSPRR